MQKLTYGEAWMAEKESLTLMDGELVQTVHIEKRERKMTRQEAAKYYNAKLFDYWVNQLDESLRLELRESIVSLFMFGHTNKYEIFSKKDI